MYIKKASIQGPCKGVIGAIKKVSNLINNSNVQRPIYMLGSIVHNENVTNAFKSKGVIILDGSNKLKSLENIKSGTVIITAHGVSDEIYDYLNHNDIDYVDCTCSYVNKTKDLIKEKIKLGYSVLYLGVKNHPECESVCLIEHVHLINYKDAIKDNYSFSDDLDLKSKVILTCQTTLSYVEVEKVYEKLRRFIPHLELAGEVCSATRLRQSALIRECDGFDLCLVVGDKFSNNTNSLKEVAINYANCPSEVVSSIDDLKNFSISDNMRIFITSGASTPKVIVDSVVDFLESNGNIIKNISLDEYIKIR